ncbi:MASE1 domain-containing protein [Ramlibacter sp. PS3R-8]|uniref:ATP-binding protein n=1 Tax=Ramlibacter sp. PS3R-8 TaxID=3133437 RepID=UPI00309B1704
MDRTAENHPGNVRWHLPAAAAGVAAIYYAGAKLGLALTSAPLPISVLWPPNALLLAALLLSPRRWWWGLIAAVFPAHLLAQAQGDVPMVMALCWYVSNVCEALIGAGLMAWLGGPGPVLRSARSVLIFLCVAVAAPFLSSFLDAAFVVAVGWGDVPYATLWEVRFFSNMLSVLIFVPALVTCVQAPAGEFPRLSRSRAPEAALLAAGLLTACTIAFNFGSIQPAALSLLCLLVPFLLWAAFRFGPSFISTAYAGVAVLVIVSTSQGHGPFVQDASMDAVLPIQLFLIAMALPLLLLAGLNQDLRAAQGRLREARGLVEAVFRHSPDALAVTRQSDGHVLQANAGWWNLPPGQSGRMPDESELTFGDADGQERVVLVCTTGVDVDGEACDIRMARDVTAQRRAEADAREQDRQLKHLARVASLTDFSGTLAHELNQPLAAILSNAQAALRMLDHTTPNVTEIRAILRDIAEADKRAGVLIHHLRLLMKNSDEAFAPLDTNHMVEEVLALVHGEFISRKVELKTSFCGDLPQVRGDRVQLQQLVLNLVLNACEAMEQGGRPERVLSVGTHHGADGTVQILVTDTGPGIQPDLMPGIFKPFYTTKTNGLGLGLSICRKIAANHGGSLSVRSSPGEGANFRVVLPSAHAAR